jgi:hypothetical protein
VSYFGALWLADRLGLAKGGKMPGGRVTKPALAAAAMTAFAIAAAWIFSEGWVLAGLIVVIAVLVLPGVLTVLARIRSSSGRPD